ncbi:MAG TPA: D-alanine--D-alanine ligase family protein [Thermoanaerobaculia bacterium]|jgi:D-alanine-D-alanine ligase|nr:D-alanine--D-alanine ligase family protein [Thermoanaerobaculia bacterium]
MAHVGVIFGGRSVEHQVSIRSARTVVDGLRTAGHQVTPLGIAQDGCWIDAEASEAVLSGGIATIAPLELPIAPTLRHLLASGVEVLFPIVHGTWGEDGTLQGLCEMIDAAYVGPGVTASALAMDKLLFKRQMEAAGVPVVEYEAVRRNEFAADPAAFLHRAAKLPFPVFVKPSVGGSSVGVKKVMSPDLLEAGVRFALQFDDTVIIERGVQGRELECAVLGYQKIEASAVGEIVPGNEFYDYADKYLQDTAQLIAPAELSPEATDRLRALAVRAFEAIGGVGLARVDFLVEGEDGIYVNEVNTLPGFTSISMYPRLWGLSGVPLPELVDRLVRIALDRHRDRRRLDEGIKEFLESL